MKNLWNLFSFLFMWFCMFFCFYIMILDKNIFIKLIYGSEGIFAFYGMLLYLDNLLNNKEE